MERNDKKNLVFMIIGAVTLIAVTLGATYAYFTAQGGGTGNININATTNTTDNLSFQVGEAISLTANQEDFAQGMSNKSGSTYAKAILTANNATNTATRNYYVYLNITSNDFEYTTEDEQAEILLKVTDPEVVEVTTLGSLERKTSGEVTGFDITTKTGSITIADNYEITSTGTEEQEWKIEVIFANLDSDQNKNTGKTFNANLIIREDLPIGITEVSASNITSNSITLTVDAESENTITKYYYAKNEEEYVESDSNTYTFTGLDAATEYTLKVYAVDDEGYQSAVYSTEESTAELTLAELCAIPLNSNLLSCSVYNQYTEDGVNDLYLHDGVGTYGILEAGDNSYRYAGSNPNNYVCFGSDEESCPEDNLYRIIGVFNDQVKLIKADFANSDLLGTDGDYNSSVYNKTDYANYKGNKETINRYYWNYSNGSSSKNDWSTSRLNTINLNTNYLNALGSEWTDKIATTTWQVGGAEYANVYSSPVTTAYNYEVGANKVNTTYSAKIGLMYVSDYGYAASPENWTVNMGSLDNDTNRNNNWMYSGVYEWTISRYSDYTLDAFFVNYAGCVYNNNVNNLVGVRPSFYLESSVEFSSGDGTIDSPYRILV